MTPPPSEFLSSVADPTIPIIVAGAAGTDIRIATLGELYPCPSIYQHVRAAPPISQPVLPNQLCLNANSQTMQTDRKQLLDTGAALAAKGLPLPTEPAAAALYQAVLQATSRSDRRGCGD